MPSFDIVSKVDLMEPDNALHTAQKEIGQRYDFRGTNTTLERGPEGITIRTSDETRAAATITVLRERMSKRGVSQRCLDVGDVEPAGGQTMRQLIKIKQGIESVVAKQITGFIRDGKFKVTTQIQGEEVRVTAKSRDELQAVIAAVRVKEFPVSVQFVNFRD